MSDMQMTTLSRFEKDQQLRDALVCRIEVLNRVKKLMLIPELQMATTRQIADFYDVEKGTVDQCIKQHKRELETDGILTLTAAELLHSGKISAVERQKTGVIISLGEGELMKLNHNKTTYFPRRAILRIGMLLEKSVVAEEVRNQLLNTYERASVAQRTEAIDEEQVLITKVMFADSIQDRAIAINDLHHYHMRNVAKIAELEITNQALTEEKTALSDKNAVLSAEKDTLAETKAILTLENESHSRANMHWSDRAIVDRLVKMYCGKAYKPTMVYNTLKMAWQKFYSELYYDYRIALHNRRKLASDGSKIKGEPTPLDFVRDEEWPLLVSKAFSMCRRIGCHVEYMLHNDVVYQRIMTCEGIAANQVLIPEELDGEEQETLHNTNMEAVPCLH